MLRTLEYIYIVLSAIQLTIIIFFFIKIKCLVSTKIFEDNDIFEDKNSNRVKLLAMHITYAIFVSLQNLGMLYIWISDKEGIIHDFYLNIVGDPDD